MTLSTDRLALSVVAPCFNEEDGLAEFCRRVSASCQACVDMRFEILLIDDGSGDRTLDVMTELAAENPHVVAVSLFRNHGHQLAATAGLALARGERVLLIDADLQDPPELLSAMMQLMDGGADVVYGRRTRRRGETWFKIATASLFYRVLARLSSVPIPRDTGDFRLMRRRVVELLLLMPERQRFIRGMVSWIGGRQVAIDYERHERFAGETGYGLSKMVRFAIDAVTGFSTIPLRMASWLGLVIAAVSLALMAYTIVVWARGDVVTGWSSTMTAITLFASVQLMVLGVIGEYLGRLVNEVKGRPLFIIDAAIIGGERYPIPVHFSRFGPAERESFLAALPRHPAAQERTPPQVP